MNILLPEKVETILNVLQSAGQKAYIVGGCVRDALLGRTPHDWDITTSAPPGQVKRLFPHTVDTGLKHGTVTVLMGREGFEVTTFRIDGEYEDSRHPKEVVFSDNLAEDLARRDFTINAMAYNPREGLMDFYDGVGDLERKIIRCVGEPAERFTEDALRIMRAVRFAAQLGFTIDPLTQEAVQSFAPTLKKISAERIRDELLKTIQSPHPEWLRLAWSLGLTKVFLPEFDQCMACEQNNPHHCYSVGEHILHSMENVEPDGLLRLTMLLHDMAKPLCRTRDENGVDHFYRHGQTGEKLARVIMHRLRLDSKTIDTVARLVYWHDYRMEPTSVTLRKAVNKMGNDIFPLFLQVQRADVLAQSEYKRKEKLERLNRLELLYQDILASQDCLSLKSLALKGKDLIEIGYQPGPELGAELNRLLERVLVQPELNRKETLLFLAREDKNNSRA
ncbi:MAG: HD domain-containing protein [Blautia sp.]|nr:HD domain-containing protein [Blautia sp.]